MFRISEVVGVSRPAKPATLFRAISKRFIQTDRWANIAKKISMTPASGGAAVSGTKIRAFDQSLASGAPGRHSSHAATVILVSE
ncbi:hypothetical protein ACVWVY_008070 [Bradyrhizobium sp. URHC0002]